MTVSWKFSLCLSYDAHIPLLGIYPREKKAYGREKICTWMFIAALFVIVENWKQLKCPSQWVDKQVYA